MANLTDELVFLDTDCYCPVCGSSNIGNDNFEFSSDVIYNRCTCDECGSKFTFAYWVRDATIDKDNYNKED